MSDTVARTQHEVTISIYETLLKKTYFAFQDGSGEIVLRSKSGDDLATNSSPSEKYTTTKPLKVEKAEEIQDQRRPYSSSSEGSETDVAGEVDHLHLR